MLEQLLIFTRGGLILWTCKEFGNALRGSPVNSLIQSCLLEERSGAVSYEYDAPGVSYTLKWTFNNELRLVFVAVYQRFLNLVYVDELLALVKRQFSDIYQPKRVNYSDFDEVFRQLRAETEARAEGLKKLNRVDVATGIQSRKTQQVKNGDGRITGDRKDGGADDGDDDADDKAGFKPSNEDLGFNHSENEVCKGGGATGCKDNSGTINEAFNVSKLKKFRSRGVKKTSGVINKSSKPDPKKKQPKKNTVWDDGPRNMKLDHTDPTENGIELVDALPVLEEESMMDKTEIVSNESESEGDEGKKNAMAETKKTGWFSSVLQSIAGKTHLEKTDLEPALKVLKDQLMAKNVAETIAEKLCESVAASLEGRKVSSFTRISSTVKAAMENAVERILTPKRSIDILRDVFASKEQGKPYVVVFVGVNGVGKSTNLAKVAFWLQSHNIKVMIAACDTFRSGAVEQLLTHGHRLQIPIFQMGYEKNPTNVAREAIQQARRDKLDVVLVDTAGRMQDNEPLMRALSDLVKDIKPDLVLFVGEALVGNDAVDQLSKFNQGLANLSTSSNPRLIDGILLTKFDTIDDKVGAALSMVYTSGAPIMFVGCGQSYPDLKRLNVKSIVKTLLR